MAALRELDKGSESRRKWATERMAHGKQFDQEEDTARTSRKETKKREAQPFPWAIPLTSCLYFKACGQIPLSCLLLSSSLLLFLWVVVVWICKWIKIPGINIALRNTGAVGERIVPMLTLKYF